MSNDPIRRHIMRKFREGAKRYPEFAALFFALGAVALLQPVLELGREVMLDRETGDFPLFITAAVLFLFAVINMIYYTAFAVRARLKK